ncbi:MULTISPECIES: branched-chain amino acid transport system II carrier protein [Clostridium]|uniref:Branched-chain amino acid transport system carrier protein n=1 Tax=Clostridium cadaveris TaxID=1529 RepID=A0A1I2KSJ8_9CLOT|nr:branched-chain amino acid transport system II carrier protein [Clostridium cadaveris]MDU4952773.1 branched-chain amino acid transport system II carrier protein [Clostridium sp.]MDM8312780.1 branched-chain amino acid transport system II carrier protein [Clostridium cadaveris]MDY4949847.1 branched-chain amino acid transport system II carrier protein [Clostridium cadaveris]NME64969.1 branched-chain amino acid transport system II carrier protein [Clostridium cadaveris]NWK10820.1 branched-chain 
MKKTYAKDVFISGFALFAMFFGAGNLIFPPYLGWSSASNWFLGFLCFIITDIGLSMLGIIVVGKVGKGAQGVTEPLGKFFSILLLAVDVICLGPLIAIPRTAATTFEFAILPNFTNINSWVFSIIFFAIVVTLSIKQTKAVDIVGAVLAPIMFIALILLIIKGTLSPLGFAERTTVVGTVVSDGIKAGYQTMDMMGAIIMALALTFSMKSKGYTEPKQQFKMISQAGIISSIALFSVYGGLAYLGSTVSSVFSSNMSQAELLIAITSGLLGKSGIILLGVIVAFACITTAIGLLSSASTFFEEISNGKFKYKTNIIVGAVISCFVSNLGISAIINFAAPILDLIYPVLIVLIVLGAFNGKIKNLNIHKAASLGAFAVSLATLIQNITGINLGINMLPLNNIGFGWLIPSVVMGIVGSFIKKSEVHVKNILSKEA